MPTNKARPPRLALALFPDRRRRGRPFKLVGSSYLQFLNAIREIHAKNRRCASNLSIARELRKRPKYKDLSERQLRRDVGDVISEQVDEFKEVPPESWREWFGIDPPPAITREWLLRRWLN
jgi:hypothetical protein